MFRPCRVAARRRCAQDPRILFVPTSCLRAAVSNGVCATARHGQQQGAVVVCKSAFSTWCRRACLLALVVLATGSCSVDAGFDATLDAGLDTSYSDLQVEIVTKIVSVVGTSSHNVAAPSIALYEYTYPVPYDCPDRSEAGHLVGSAQTMQVSTAFVVTGGPLPVTCSLDGSTQPNASVNLAPFDLPAGAIRVWTTVGIGYHDVSCSLQGSGGTISRASRRFWVSKDCGGPGDNLGPAVCNDGNPCTGDYCTGSSCFWTELDNCCASNDGCPLGETCVGLPTAASVCGLTAADCSDGVDCSTDSVTPVGAPPTAVQCTHAQCQYNGAQLLGFCAQFQTANTLSPWSETPASSPPRWTWGANSAGLNTPGHAHVQLANVGDTACLISPVLNAPTSGTATLQFWEEFVQGSATVRVRTVASPSQAQTGNSVWTETWDGTGQPLVRKSVTLPLEATSTAWPRSTNGGGWIAVCVTANTPNVGRNFDDFCVDLGVPPALDCTTTTAAVADLSPATRLSGIVATRSDHDRPVFFSTVLGPTYVQFYPGLFNGHDNKWYAAVDLRSVTPSAPEYSDVVIRATEGVLAADCALNLRVWQRRDFLLWAPGPTPDAEVVPLATAATELGLHWTRVDDLGNVGALGDYRSVIVLLHSYPNAVHPSEAELDRLLAYVDGGGSLALSGGEFWTWALSGASPKAAALASRFKVTAAYPGVFDPYYMPGAPGFWIHLDHSTLPASSQVFGMTGSGLFNRHLDALAFPDGKGTLRITPTSQMAGPGQWAEGAHMDASGYRTVAMALSFASLSNTGVYTATVHAKNVLQFLVGPQPSCTVATQCEDANPCTQDRCLAGQCDFGLATVCNDIEACTTDTCLISTGCAHVPVVGPCNDGVACTLADECTQGVCIGLPNDATCSDGSACTADWCSPWVGCSHLALTTTCDDGVACTEQDTCVGGACIGTASATACNDNNPCTDDSCSGGCVHVLNSQPCDDGNSCTGNDACESGTCAGTAEVFAPGGYCSNVDYPATLPALLPDPATIAPPLPKYGIKFADSVSFVYKGPQALQSANPGTAGVIIADGKVAIVRGRVVEIVDGTSVPVIKARVFVPSHPAWGQTFTRSDGRFDLAVEGGATSTIAVVKPGYFSVQRQVDAGALDYRVVDDVVLTRPDPNMNSVAMSPSSATGTVVEVESMGPPTGYSDDGARKVAMLLPPNTTAWRVPAGTVPTSMPTPATSLQIRVTEYTSSSSGPAAMPADIPPATAYTWCAEFSDDQAQAAGQDVRFDRPVPVYVDNFLNFPLGASLPVGYYDRQVGAWKQIAQSTSAPSSTYAKNAIVLMVYRSPFDPDVYVSFAPGIGPMPTDLLDSFGIDQTERSMLYKYLTDRFSSADFGPHEFWRFQIDHMTPYDVNPDWRWVPSGYGPPVPPPPPPSPTDSSSPPDNDPDSTQGADSLGDDSGDTADGTDVQENAPGPEPKLLDGVEQNPDRQCTTKGSIIQCESRSLAEEIPVVGTPFALRYDSRRTPGGAAKSLNVATFSAPPTDTLDHLDQSLHVAGTVASETVAPLPSTGSKTMTWSGLDAYGRQVGGIAPATVRATAYYQVKYSVVGLNLWIPSGTSTNAPPETVRTNLVARGCCDNWNSGQCATEGAAGVGATWTYADGSLCAARGQSSQEFFVIVPPPRFATAGPAAGFNFVPAATSGMSPARSLHGVGAFEQSYLGGGEPSADLGGWGLTVHHDYDATAQAVVTADTDWQFLGGRGQRATSIAGGGPTVLPVGACGADVAGASADLDSLGLVDATTTSDGRVWLLGSSTLFALEQDGVLRCIADSSNWKAGTPTSLAASKDGSLYVGLAGAGGGLFRLPAGQPKLAQNLPVEWRTGQGGVPDLTLVHAAVAAKDVRVQVNDVAEGPDGALYLAAAGSAKRIWRIDPNGIIGAFAGTGADTDVHGFPGTCNCYADGGPALNSCLGEITEIAVAADGLVLAGSYHGHIFGVDPTGNVHLLSRSSIVGAALLPVTPIGDLNPDGSCNASAHSCRTDDAISGLTAAPGNQLAFCQTMPNYGSTGGTGGTAAAVYAADVGWLAVGNVRRVAGLAKEPQQAANQSTVALQGGAPSELVLPACYGVTALGNGSWLVLAKVRLTNGNDSVRLLRISTPDVVTAEGLTRIPHADGQTVRAFDASGRHVKTIDATTGRELLTFGYADGKLASVTEPNEDPAKARTTSIARSSSQIVITSPENLATTLELDENGRLDAIRNPANEVISMTYDADKPGLLQSLTVPETGTSSFTWSDTGHLSTDMGAAGNTTTLTAVENPAQRDTTVAVTTLLGRTTLHGWRHLDDGSTSRKSVDSAGAESISKELPYTTDVNDKGEAWSGSDAHHPATRVAKSASGASTWVRTEPSKQFPGQVQEPAEFWTRLSTSVEAHVTLGSVYSFDSVSGLPIEVTRTLVLDGGRTGESPSTWTTEARKQGGLWQTTASSPSGQTAQVQFNADMHPVEIKGSGRPPVTIDYYPNGLPHHVTATSATSATDQRTTTYEWDAKRRLSSVAAGGMTVGYSYDIVGRTTSVQLAATAAVGLPPDDVGRLQSVNVPADASANPPQLVPPAYVYDYWPNGQVKSATLPAVTSAPPGLVGGQWKTSYDFDGDSELATITRPDGKQWVIARDNVPPAMTGKILSVSAPNDANPTGPAVVTSIDYLENSSRVEAVTQTGQGSTRKLKYSYDGALPKSEEWLCDTTGCATDEPQVGAKVSRTFDNRARLWTTTLQPKLGPQTTVEVSYDAANRPTLLQVKQAGVATPLAEEALTYHSDSGRLDARHVRDLAFQVANPGADPGASAVSVYYTWNGFGELQRLELASGDMPGLLSRLEINLRDALGRIQVRTRSAFYGPGLVATDEYSYHPTRGWLATALTNAGGSGTGGSWLYDARGNRTGSNVGSSAGVTAEYDEQDRLVVRTGPGFIENFAYDLNGRLVFRSSPAGKWKYTWTAAGQLLQATHFPAGSLTADKTLDYVLDPAGRRVAVKKDGAYTAGYLYDGALRVIGKTDGNGRLLEQYVYGTLGHSPDFALLWDSSGNYVGAYLFSHDQLGSVVDTWQVRGFGSALLQKATTSRVDFGPWGEAEVLTADVASGPDHPFGYAGGLWDRDTGLVRFGAREYDAELGRWLSRDPIGFAGGWNQFGYVAGDPVNLVDPLGLWPDGNPNDFRFDNPQAQQAFDKAQLQAAALMAIVGGVLGSGGLLGLAESATLPVVEAVAPYLPAWLLPAAGLAVDVANEDPCAPSLQRAVRFGETAATRAGREAHRLWDPGQGFIKEFRLPSGLRPDAVNFNTKQVLELKPNNARAIRLGWKQVGGYVDELNREFGGGWSGNVVTY